MHDEPFIQYGVRAVDPPPGVREEWRMFVDLALAMDIPLFKAKAVNRFLYEGEAPEDGTRCS